MDKFRDKTRDNLYDNLINLGVDCKLAKRKIVEEKLFNSWYQRSLGIIEINENTLSVSTPHEMKGYDHYIIKHIVLDNRFNIISEKVFDPSKETPISKHNIIGYEDKLYVLSICNNHDTWVDIIKIKKP